MGIPECSAVWFRPKRASERAEFAAALVVCHPSRCWKWTQFEGAEWKSSNCSSLSSHEREHCSLSLSARLR